MALRKTRPPTPEGNRRRNIEILERLAPGKRTKQTLRECFSSPLWTVLDFWARHVTQRELHKMLDRARLRFPDDEGWGI